MAEPSQAAEESNVCVAVKIRPLVAHEVDDGCTESLFVTPGCPQISTGQHTFTYDHVFGEGATAPDQLYPRCIAPLVDGLFKGYNATVFAYGQTGSGKTFTMGSEYRPGAKCRGVIPDTINDIFNRIDAAKDRAVTVRVSFVEIHKEEVKDLLLPASSGPRPAVTIRETPNGDVALYGAVEKEVRSREEMAEVLELGALCRSTASTSMNNRSSRSHAIFTITLEQRRQVQQAVAQAEQGVDDDGDDDDDAAGEEAEGVEDFLGAKMHLVDLAGSERAKRTKAEGARLREGIHINRGLLALGNVINAIVDNHKHVPYRDSKLTRLLQDSLGGNSRTVMIACVSPADANFEESLNTLRYADRARHIRNKPVVNRDPVAAQLAVLRTTIAQLKSENVSLRRALAASGSESALDASGLGNNALENLVERLTQDNTSLESENMRLKMDLDDIQRQFSAVTDKWHTAQAQCDLMRMNQAAAVAGLQGRQDSAGGAGGGSHEMPLPGLDIVKGYVARIAELEAEVNSMKSLTAHMPFTRRRVHGLEPHTPGGASTPGDLDTTSPGPSSVLGGTHEPAGAGDDVDADDDPSLSQHPELADEEEYFMAELAAHTLNQEKMKKEVALLQRQLEAKERKMVELMKNAGSMPALKQHYDRVLADLEAQRDTLVAERKALLEKLAAVSAANEEERKRLEATYTDRIHQYDERLKELRRKERDFIAMQKLKQRTEDAHRRLSADILRLKQQKVAVQKQLETNAKQFAAWRHERERELGQLRKQSRKDRAQIQHLQAMAAKQSAVLQRKISDATAARKRIKELEEEKRRKNAGSSSAASQQQAAAALAAQQAMGGNVEIQPNAQAPPLRTDKDRREWLERELGLCNMSCEFRKVIEGELAQRAEAARKLKDLEKWITQLEPASPLFMSGGGSSILPVSPSASSGSLVPKTSLSPGAREKLMAKKRELEEKVAYHNGQIAELQADWERQKTEEESRGGGALDIRRWAGLRNVAECRELLRTLFRLGVEAKTLNNELTVDMMRYTEEIDVLRVQLDGAQKKCAQYRKLAMVLQAAAAHVVSAPQYNNVSAQDDTDKQVDAVLEALHVVRNNTPPAASGGGGRTTGTLGGATEAVTSLLGYGEGAAASVGQTDDVEMEDAGPLESPNVARGTAKALEFLSPVPSGARRHLTSFEAPSSAAPRYSPGQDGDSEDSGDKGRPDTEGASSDDYCAMDVDGDTETERIQDDDGGSEEGTDSEEEDDEEVDSDNDADSDWDPNNATPAVRGRTGRRSVGPGGAGGSSRRCSQRHSLIETATSSGEGELMPENPLSRPHHDRTGSRRNSNTTEDAAIEAVILDDINLKRYTAGQQQRLGKLTVKHLKDALKGRVIDGQKWHATNAKGRYKTRAELIQDYYRMLELGKFSSRPQSSYNTPDVEKVGEIGGGGGQMDGGVKPAGSRETDPAADDEGFTFSPHPIAPLVAAASGTPVGPPLVPPLVGLRSQSPSYPPSGRRAASINNLGPWARSSLVAQPNSSRQYTWASSLRSSCTLPPSDSGGAASEATASMAAGPSGLTRTNSGINAAAVPRGPPVAILQSSAALEAGGAAANSSRRAAWAAPPTGQVSSGNGPLSYRGAVMASPQQNVSPRLLRPPPHAGAAGTSPRSSMSSPTPRSVPRSAGRPSAGRAHSPGMSPDPRDRGFGYQGGENMQPDATTPRGTMNGTPGEGKSITPLTNLYKEKAAAARERTAALRVSMHKNWEQQDQQRSASGVSGSANVRSSLNGPVGTTGTVASSIDGSLRGGGGVRDSIGAGLATSKQKAIWR